MLKGWVPGVLSCNPVSSAVSSETLENAIDGKNNRQFPSQVPSPFFVPTCSWCHCQAQSTAYHLPMTHGTGQCAWDRSQECHPARYGLHTLQHAPPHSGALAPRSQRRRQRRRRPPGRARAATTKTRVAWAAVPTPAVSAAGISTGTMMSWATASATTRPATERMWSRSATEALERVLVASVLLEDGGTMRRASMGRRSGSWPTPLFADVAVAQPTLRHVSSLPHS